MARVDYEAAWTELGDLIAAREGWGSKTLALEMMRVAARHRVSEGLLERVLRLYGGRLHELFASTPAEALPSGEDGTPILPAEDPAPPQTRGGHDGSRTYAGHPG